MPKFRLMFLTLLLIAGGCQMHDKNTDNNTDNNANNQNNQVENRSNNNLTTEEGKKAATRLEQLAKEVPNVKNAQAVVLGNYAIVAIDVDENLDRTQIGSIKYTVSESFQNEPYGKNALIVADPDVKARLRDVANDIQAGKPISGILNELSEIASRIIPSVPDSDKTNQNPPSNQEEKNIEQKQQNQTNKNTQ
ncbi:MULTISPECIES: YhcN/YlaJ family sporulation lipoprotein [Bacillus]|uniref:YhcN/YlaJ family sporulation lipoprotein n=1 Tax=Bacillus TaxID=1386 RepID=UPI00037D399E|nr:MULTISPECIES: YhcN/YlaJ family sporulation lipoprotein [Bacillus]